MTKRTIRPMSVDIKALAAKNGNLLTKDEMRVLINILKMAKEENSWKEFYFEKYLKESLDSRRDDEGIIHENFLKTRGWLEDPQDDGRYAVTDELIEFLRPFCV